MLWIVVVAVGLLNALASTFIYGFILSPLFFSDSGGLASLAGAAYAFIPFAFVEILIVSALISTFVLRRRSGEPSRQVAFFLITFFIFIVSHAIVLYAPYWFEKISYKLENPIQTGVRQYDFSGDVVISARQTSKNTLRMDDNTVTWIEHTGINPNVWEPLSFHFDVEKGTGETARLENESKFISVPPKTYECSETPGIGTVQTVLLRRDLRTDKVDRVNLNLQEQIGYVKTFFSCDEKYMVYSVINNDGRSRDYRETTLYIYSFDSGETEVVGKSLSAKFKDGHLYTWAETYPADRSERVIYSKNISTGKTIEFLRIQGQEEWDTSGAFAVYEEPFPSTERDYFPSYITSLHLKRVPAN